jgi:hypothetical protein
VVDDCTRECLALIADTSISGNRVARELDRLLVERPLFGFHDKLLDLSLPLGISFITFTLAAFIVDVYRGNFPAVPSPATILAYVQFFPHLYCGSDSPPGRVDPATAGRNQTTHSLPDSGPGQESRSAGT